MNGQKTISRTTDGIKISVEPTYQPNHSRPLHNKYMFSYRISIENDSTFTVQLLWRHWFIYDSNATLRAVDGEGVIGELPILSPGETHEYESWCELMTDLGKMYGYYTFVRQTDGEQFKVMIPEFQLVDPTKLN